MLEDPKLDGKCNSVTLKYVLALIQCCITGGAVAEHCGNIMRSYRTRTYINFNVVCEEYLIFFPTNLFFSPLNRIHSV